MKFMKIYEDGFLAEIEKADYMSTLAEVGPEGWNRIQLTSSLSAFVNDCSLLLPDRYKRNPIGGLTIIALGARLIPYAGPIVITGWDPSATNRDEPEIIGLTPLQVAMIRAANEMIDEIICCKTPDVREEVVNIANMINYGDIPPVTIRTTGKY